jgi:4'-phosphopantetheinyl transferase
MTISLDEYQSGQSPPDLGDNEIHLWLVKHDETAIPHEAGARWLSSDENARAVRFCSQALRDRFRADRIFLRGMLAAYLELPPEEIRFSYGANGKPLGLLTGPGNLLNFNLTHSGAVTMCAVALNFEIGLDLEQLRTVPDMNGIADRFFCAEEVACLMNIPAGQRQEGFFRYWTAKEAFIKATGEGLSRPLDSFAVRFCDHQQQIYKMVNKGTAQLASNWHVRVLDFMPAFIGALVDNATSETHCSLLHWNLEALVRASR